MRKPDRKPTAGELVALVVALVIGFGVAIYFGNLVWAIAVVTAVAIVGFGFFFTTGSDLCPASRLQRDARLPAVNGTGERTG